jgi:nitroreductase
MSEIEYRALEAAAREALLAPSVFNTQPWQWRISGNALELRADWSRQLTATDPDGHSLLLSCGAALHHARISLLAAGWLVSVDRIHGEIEGRALARICLLEPAPPDPVAVVLREAIHRRRTDRRPFADEPVPAEALNALGEAAVAEGVRLHRVGMDQMPMLAIAVSLAAADEISNPEYLLELMRWTNRPEWSEDGVPPSTAVRKVPRRVPVREFAVPPNDGIPVEPGGDRGAAYLILHGDGGDTQDWLRAGEALSAVLLTAVSRGLAVAPLTDVLEVEHPRELVQGLLREGGMPYALVRCGYPVDSTPLAAAPRRSAGDVIQSAAE